MTTLAEVAPAPAAREDGSGMHHLFALPAFGPAYCPLRYIAHRLADDTARLAAADDAGNLTEANAALAAVQEDANLLPLLMRIRRQVCYYTHTEPPPRTEAERRPLVLYLDALPAAQHDALLWRLRRCAECHHAYPPYVVPLPAPASAPEAPA